MQKRWFICWRDEMIGEFRNAVIDVHPLIWERQKKSSEKPDADYLTLISWQRLNEEDLVAAYK